MADTQSVFDTRGSLGGGGMSPVAAHERGDRVVHPHVVSPYAPIATPSPAHTARHREGDDEVARTAREDRCVQAPTRVCRPEDDHVARIRVARADQ